MPRKLAAVEFEIAQSDQAIKPGVGGGFDQMPRSLEAELCGDEGILSFLEFGEAGLDANRKELAGRDGEFFEEFFMHLGWMLRFERSLSFGRAEWRARRIWRSWWGCRE